MEFYGNLRNWQKYLNGKINRKTWCELFYKYTNSPHSSCVKLADNLLPNSIYRQMKIFGLIIIVMRHTM